MNLAKFVKTSYFHTLYGPVSCSMKQVGQLNEFLERKQTT